MSYRHMLLVLFLLLEGNEIKIVGTVEASQGGGSSWIGVIDGFIWSGWEQQLHVRRRTESFVSRSPS